MYKSVLKHIMFHLDPSGDQLNRGFVQYTFRGKPHSILQTPKQTVSEVTSQKGGIVNANAVGDLSGN